METAVVENCFQVNQGEPRQGAFVQGLGHTFFYGRDVLLWDLSPGDLCGEGETNVSFLGFRPEDHMSELAVAARLLLVTVFTLGDLGDGLAVGHPRHLHPQVGAKLPLDPFQGYIDLRVAQAGDQGFTGPGVTAELEGWVLLHDPAQGHGHLVQVVLGSRCDRHPEVTHRLFDLREFHRIITDAQCVSGE